MYLLEKIGLFNKRCSLWFLNIAQFGAVVNDNIYKFIMVFMLIDLFGPSSASTILSGAGAVFVIPFLLFSSAAGIMSDRHSKKWIITILKMAEVAIFIAAIFVVRSKSPFWTPVGLYLLLFCLATHSAIFGPPKYSIIPELVPGEKVPRANGLITSCTYLAIIVGTFLASFLSAATNCNYVGVILICLALAVFGLLSALCIQRTPKQGSLKKIHLFFLKEIYQTLCTCRLEPHLLVVLLSSSFFLFIGSFTQLNIIPYALDAMHLSEIYGGYLFLCTALGIATGAFLVGKVLQKPIPLWIPCAAGFGVAFFLFALFLFPHHLWFVLFFLFFLGVFGGMFVVPLDSFVQLACPNETRGQVIAAGNFLGFCGVLISSLLLYFISNILKLSPITGFGIIGVLTLLYAIFLFFRFSDFTLPMLVKCVLRPAVSLELNDLTILDPHSRTAFVLQQGSLIKCLILTATMPHHHFVFIEEKSSPRRFFLNLFYSFQTLTNQTQVSTLLKTKPICFVLPEVTIPPFLPRYLIKIEMIAPENAQQPIRIRFTSNN